MCVCVNMCVNLSVCIYVCVCVCVCVRARAQKPQCHLDHLSMPKTIDLTISTLNRSLIMCKVITSKFDDQLEPS